MAVAGAALLVPAGTSADAAFTAATTNGSNSWTVGEYQQRYVDAVLADRPYLFHLTDETGGSWAADNSGNSRTGRYTGIRSYRVPGALPNNFGYAVDLGANGRIVTDGPSVFSPTSFTIEAWFRTTTSAGGPLIGFESSRDSWSLAFDRQLRMESTGRLTYGAWGSLGQRPLTTSTRYNDGKWHHVAVSVTGRGLGEDAVLYVDGKQVASGDTSLVSFYWGWWRVGAGTVQSKWGTPAPAGFDGIVDNVAVFHAALPAQRVATHYAAR